MRALRTATIMIACAVAVSGCIAWNAWVPEEPLPDPGSLPPSQAIRLDPPARETGALDCSSQRCQQWFRIDVKSTGVLRVEAAIEGLGEGSIARLFIQDGAGRSLAKTNSLDGLPLRVRAPVEPGTYAVLLQAGGKAVSWTLDAGLE